MATKSVMAAPHKDPAEAIYWDAVKLAEQGQFVEACPKFAESLALERKAGTLFSLADCEDQRGRFATAVRWYGEYLTEVENLPIENKQRHSDRKKLADDRISILTPKIPTLVLVLPIGALPNAEVTLDGAAVNSESFGVSLGLDPGDHVVVTRLNGQLRQEERISLIEGQRGEVRLDVPIAPRKEPPHKAVDSLAPRSNGLRIAGFVTLGIGGTGLALWAIAGGMALSKKEDMVWDCIPGANERMQCATQQGVDAGKSAKWLGNVSTVGAAYGLSAVALGAVLLAVDAHRNDRSPGASKPVHVGFVPNYSASGGQVTISGLW